MKGDIVNYKHIKLHEDVWELLKLQATELNMSIIDYMRYLAYAQKNKRGK